MQSPPTARTCRARSTGRAGDRARDSSGSSLTTTPRCWPRSSAAATTWSVWSRERPHLAQRWPRASTPAPARRSPRATPVAELGRPHVELALRRSGYRAPQKGTPTGEEGRSLERFEPRAPQGLVRPAAGAIHRPFVPGLVRDQYAEAIRLPVLLLVPVRVGDRGGSDHAA